MAEKSIIVIGAGVAGLAAGSYARMNGYAVRLFELHDKPGGLCAAWKRSGYTFDGCIHWLVGSRPPHGFNRVWRELGALGDRPIIDPEIYQTFEDGNGRAFHLYADADRLFKHLVSFSPRDRALSADLTESIKKLTGFSPSFDQPSLFSSLGFGVRMLSLAGILQKYSAVTLEEWGAQFSDPLLKESFQNVFGYRDFPAIALLMTLAGKHARTAGYPSGGSLAFARSMEKRLLDLGGKIDYRARVKKITIEGGRACGVLLEDGTRVPADIVISAADGHATLFDMLEEKYVPEKVRRYYTEFPIFNPIIQVSLGVNRDMSGELASVTWNLKQPLVIAGEARSAFGYRHFSSDPSLAPAGKTVIVCMFNSDFVYWKQLLDQGRPAYDGEKARVLAAVVDELEKRFSGIKAQVEVSDVATPLTYQRYTGNWQGSMEGWRLTKETMRFMMNGMDATLPGVKDFYMIGQWVKPGGGLPPAAQSGREAVAEICRRDRKKFQTSIEGL
jgi:phytoene dehydrogenase-like protein